MLESLSERLQNIFSGLRGKGRLTEEDINSAMREIRLALLEADVNFKVVKQFCARTKERCLTAEVLESLTPAQNVVKIVLDEPHRAFWAAPTRSSSSRAAFPTSSCSSACKARARRLPRPSLRTA